MNTRIKSFFGKTFLILGYIVLFALALISMLFFPPLCPLLLIFGVALILMKDSDLIKKKANVVLKIAGGSLFSCLILIELVNVSGSKNSDNNAAPHIPTVIAKSQAHSQKNNVSVQKSTAGPTITAESELERKNQVIIQEHQEQQHKRAVAKAWWNKNAKALAEGQGFLIGAQNYIRNGNRQAAVVWITDAAASARFFSNTNNPPDGWDDVASDFSTGLDSMDECYRQMIAVINGNDDNIQPSESNSCTDARASFNEAQSAAHSHWSDMGGAVADLLPV